MHRIVPVVVLRELIVFSQPSLGILIADALINSCFDCRSSAYLPSGLGTVEELIEAAAAAIPAPAYSTWRALDQQLAPNFIDPHNLHVLPPSAVHDEKAAEAMGFVRLKPLQCCNGCVIRTLRLLLPSLICCCHPAAAANANQGNAHALQTAADVACDASAQQKRRRTHALHPAGIFRSPYC